MSESTMKTPINVYIVEDIDSSGSIDRANRLLAGFEYGAEKAISSAIKRAVDSGETHGAKAVRKHYHIKAGDFEKYTKAKSRIYTSGGESTLQIVYRGHHIPLLRFNTSLTSDGRIKTSVKKSSSSQIFAHAFPQIVGKKDKHLGMLERVGKKRLPIEEKFGPSTPQMMGANADVAKEIGDKVSETFEKRLDHEILRILNGWR